MSDTDDGERTEEPTAKRRQEASDEGRIPRSQELGTAALLLGAGATVSTVIPVMGSQLVDLFGSGLRAMGSVNTSPGATIELLQGTGKAMVGVITLLAAGTAATALSVGAVQARGVLTTHPLLPSFDRINPLANARRLLGMQPIVETAKSLTKMSIVGFAVWKALGAAWPDVVDLSSRDAMSLASTINQHAVKLLLTAGTAYLALAGGDYGWQLWQHIKNMRMTKDEVRREAKQQDGDPMLKSRMRSIARARARSNMLRDVAKADVVIVNPTHRAIALRYDPLAAPAPIVLAMGERKVAERIKALAYEAGIPVIENRPLARALIASARVGMMIPAELYAAVAEILAFVLRQRALGRPPRVPSPVA